jgi:outer membrane biogenesis lipoprotein LolB
VRDVLLALLVVPVLTCCTRFGASGSEVSSRHQEQNREGGKAQSGQYTTCWVGLLHLVSELVLTCCTYFGASGSKVSSRHQEQNHEGGKAQSGQYR